jgi:Kef-type K+ transport system membrane component KefB
MLEAAGLKETWLFRKARILAIFDDLDTILFMVPLKAILIGLKWELFVILAVVFGLLIFGYKKLHKYRFPKGWRWTMMYAVIITAMTEILYYITNYHIAMEAIHIEVLLPAFILGVVIETEPEDEDHVPDHIAEAQDEKAKTYVSAIFMILVGFSMPPLFGDEQGEGDAMSAGAFVGHVVVVSILMVLGKMFPVACYQKEATLRTRLALAIGMCPRGEVGAGVILISLDLGIKGEAVGVAIVCLALNMIMTGGFILTVKRLVTVWEPDKETWVRRVSRRMSHIYAGSAPKQISVGSVHTSKPANHVSPVAIEVKPHTMDDAIQELSKKPQVMDVEPSGPASFTCAASNSTSASIADPISEEDLEEVQV